MFVAHHQPEVPAFPHGRAGHPAPRFDAAAAARQVARQVALVAELSEVARTYSFAAVIRFKCRLVLQAHLGHLPSRAALAAAVHFVDGLRRSPTRTDEAELAGLRLLALLSRTSAAA